MYKPTLKMVDVEPVGSYAVRIDLVATATIPASIPSIISAAKICPVAAVRA